MSTGGSEVSSNGGDNKRRPSAGTGWAAVLAGVGWVAKDLGERFSPDPDPWDCNSWYDYALNAVDTVAFLALVPALVGLFGAYRTSTEGNIGRAALGSAVGFGVAGVTNLLEHCARLDVLGFAYVIGALLGILLLLAFALALTRVRLLPAWSAWLLVAGTTAALLLANQGGFLVFGVAWIAVAYVVLRRRSSRRPAV